MMDAFRKIEDYKITLDELRSAFKLGDGDLKAVHSLGNNTILISLAVGEKRNG